MHSLLSGIKKLLGTKLVKKIRPYGHGIKGLLAALKEGFPAKKLVIIGITGTKGKTTTTIFTGRLANLCGVKTGYISSALINTGDFELEEEVDRSMRVRSGEIPNQTKMTTLDPFELQSSLKEMVENGCRVVVLELSSQGLEQNRHWGLGGFNIAAFLNLHPEHIEAHGGFERYKKAKSVLFSKVKANAAFIAFAKDPEAEFMWESIPDQVRATVSKEIIQPDEYTITNTSEGLTKQLSINGKTVALDMYADFEVENAMAAAHIVRFVPRLFGDVPLEVSALVDVLPLVAGVPGRMEWVVKSGQIVWNNTTTDTIANSPTLSILVDYAHEPESMKQLLEQLAFWKTKKIFSKLIHVVSCDGAGRDDWKKPVLGFLSQQFVDYTILTTDNYDRGDTPEEILKLLAQKLPLEAKDKSYFLQPVRRAAFEQALTLGHALKNDSILIVSTGVGSEYGLTQPEGKLDWDERRAWVEEYRKLLKL